MSSVFSRQSDDKPPVRAHNSSPVVAFIIGLAIIILASILNAAGLNITKLDHVRTNAVPKAQRRKDWLRPLWLLGMMLYILSQLIGSTLALDYLRAEYVAPLGSTSLIFNFLFSSLLIGNPVTANDIYGTIVVIIGVIGIVAFGSINSGLASETDAQRLTYLWRRSGWLGFFFVMSLSLLGTYVFTNELDMVLSSRSDLSAVPFAGMNGRRQNPPAVSFLSRVRNTLETFLAWVREKLEIWTAPHDDKQIAWTLGIGWACCGGGLAGMCLVFAKAAVKLITGSLSHENTGNQFGHAASIFTFLFLAVTAVFQIICLNRGLRVYDSTLVVPVFYGVYTATGFVDSLIFNDSVDAYRTWTLFLIFISIVILISGVVLLTIKKPEKSAPVSTPSSARSARGGPSAVDSKTGDHDDEGEYNTFRGARDDAEGLEAEDTLWQVGDASDDEGEDSARNASGRRRSSLGGGGSALSLGLTREQAHPGEEGVGLMHNPDEEYHGGSGSHNRNSQEFGAWNS